MLGFTVKSRERIEKSGLGVPIDLVYLDLVGTVVELLMRYEGPSVEPAPQKDHLGYRMIALEVDDMARTTTYLKTKGVEVVGVQRSPKPIQEPRSAILTATTSSLGSGSWANINQSRNGQ